MARANAWWRKLAGIVDTIAGRFRSTGALELSWSNSTHVAPVIRYGLERSEIAFSLSPVTQDTFSVLDEAKRRRTPVRLRSLKRPLDLLITDVRPVGSGIRVTGWIVSGTG
jgi:hypothetical protein